MGEPRDFTSSWSASSLFASSSLQLASYFASLSLQSASSFASLSLQLALSFASLSSWYSVWWYSGSASSLTLSPSWYESQFRVLVIWYSVQWHHQSSLPSLFSWYKRQFRVKGRPGPGHMIFCKVIIGLPTFRLTTLVLCAKDSTTLKAMTKWEDGRRQKKMYERNGHFWVGAQRAPWGSYDDIV